jgi:hypothetical protein
LEKEKGYNLEELLLGLVENNQGDVAHAREPEEEAIDINNLLDQDNENLISDGSNKEPPNDNQ